MRIPAVLFASGLALAAYALDAASSASLPEGWRLGGEAPRLYAAEVDTTDSPSGNGALALHRTETSHPYGSAWLAHSFPAAAYAGKRVRVSLHVRFMGTEPTAGQVYLGTDLGTSLQGVAFDQEWAWYRYTAILPGTIKQLDIGVSLKGPGDAKVDDIQLEVLGDAPPDQHGLRTEHTIVYKKNAGKEPT